MEETTGKQPFSLGSKLFIAALVVFTVFRMFYSTMIPMTSDEVYHWEWSRHLAFGYYDHPPLIAWLIALFTAIGGSTIFWTRLTAVLCVFGATYLTYCLGREIGGERVGVTAGFFSLVAPAMMMGSVVVTTDSPLLFFWQLTIFLVWRAVNKRQGFYWYLAGAALGLGLLSKFLIIPLIIGVGLFLAFSPNDRFWLRRKEPYLGFMLALLIFAPFIIWNSQHGWTSFVFHFTRHELNINLLRPLEYLALQALLLSPVLFGGMIWSLCLLIRRAFVRTGQDFAVEQRSVLFVLLSGWLFPVFLGLDAVRNTIGGHWPVAAYGMAWIGLALVLQERQIGHESEGKPEKMILGSWFYLTALVMTILIVAVTVNPDFINKLSVRGNSSNEAYGWTELGEKVNQLHRKMGTDNIVATSSYALSSMIAFYTPEHPYVSLLGPGTKHGRAYDIWDHWPDWTGRNVLFVSKKPIAGDTGGGDILQKSCERYETLPPLEIYHRGKVVRRFYFAVGYNFQKDPFVTVKKSYRWEKR